MSRLSATFVLNYLTRVVPSLGHVGRRMKPDRVIKRAAILVAIGGILSEKPAFAATFTWDSVFPAATSTNVSFATGQNFPVGTSGVRVQFDFGTRGGVTLHESGGLPSSGLFVGKLGGPSFSPADPNITLAAFIRNPNVVSGATGVQDWGNLTFRTAFTNAAGQRVPVNNLRYQIVDIDKDDNEPANTQPLRWQDQVTTFALLDTTGIPINVTAGAPVPLGTVPLTTPAVITTGNPAPNVTSVNTTPATARTFQGIDDGDTAANPPGSLNDPGTNNTGPERDGTTPPGTGGNALSEASNRSREGNLLVDAGANSATEFVVMYGDGNAILNPTPPVAERQHGAGVLGQIDFDPGIIGVRKEVKRVVNNGSTVTVEYEVAVTNLGVFELNNIRLDDNLARPVNTNPSLDPAIGGYFRSFGNIPGAGLAAGTTVRILPGGTLTGGNAAYNGNTVDQLLDGTDSLAIGETKTISYTVEFAPGAVTKFDTQVVASGTMPGGGITRDRSNDGARIEDATPGDNDPTAAGAIGGDTPPNTAANFATVIPGGVAQGLSSTGAGLGTGDDTVTSFILPAPSPQIGVTKQVLGQPVPVAGVPGAYDVTYLQVVRNVSSAGVTNPLLINVQLNENLEATFRLAPGVPNGAGSAVVNPSSIVSLTPAEAAAQGFTNPGFQPLPVNPGFTGNGANDLLISTGSQLNRGEYGVIRYTVRVSPRAGGPALEDPAVGFFDGQVTATATGSGGDVTDLSDDVTGIATVAADDAATAADYQSQVPRLGFVANTPAGPQPRPSADGTAAATNRNNLTPVSFAAQPAIALSKRVTNVVDNGNGTFDVTYRQVVQNIGPTTLTGVQITNENLNTTFRVGATDGARSVQVLSTTPVTSTAAFGAAVPAGFVPLTGGTFDGVGNRNLLAGTNTLTPNQYGAVDFVVRVTPGNTTESYGIPPFNDTALASGSVDGTEQIVTDPSEDAARFPKGTTGVPTAELLDANNDGIANQGATTPGAAGENTPTPVLFPQIAVAKRISSITGTGTDADPYIVEYTIVTTNVGATTLTNVQTTEPPLTGAPGVAVFPGVNATLVGPPSRVPTGLPGDVASTPNAGFDNTTTSQSLFNPLTLAPNQSTTVRYQVRLVSPPNDITFNSRSTATGSGVSAPTSPDVPPLAPRDLSDDGTSPDPNTGDGVRGRGPGEDDPTPLRFPIGPEISLFKQVFGTPVDNGDGTFDITFRYRVQNTGLVPLNNVSIADNLQAQFAGQGLNRTTNPPPVEQFLGVISTTPQPGESSPGLAPIAVGTSANRGLSDAPVDALGIVPGTLGLGQSSVVDVVVRVRPGAANLTNTYDGAARTVGVGTNAAQTQVNDISDDGTFLNGVPQTPTPNQLRPVGSPADPNAQNATPVVLSQAVPPIALFKAITAAPGQTFTQPLGLPGAPANVLGVERLSRNLNNGDQVVYTLYAVNSTPAPIANFEVCDALEGGLRFVSATNLPTGVSAAAFGPLTPPGPNPLGRTCNPASGGAGGTVVFTIPNLPTGTTALPFTVRVNR